MISKKEGSVWCKVNKCPPTTGVHRKLKLILPQIMLSGARGNRIGFYFWIKSGSFQTAQIAITTTGGICEVKKRFFPDVNAVVVEWLFGAQFRH